jgi:hypothetical protein
MGEKTTDVRKAVSTNYYLDEYYNNNNININSVCEKKSNEKTEAESAYQTQKIMQAYQKKT